MNHLPVFGSTQAVTVLPNPPTWARLYWWYKYRLPWHKGKARLLAALLHAGLRRGNPFLCTMNNGAKLAISPHESRVPASVGWTCFEARAWEPYVEKWIRALLRRGECAIDVGANIGFFTSVMCQCVGSLGAVYAFEPVPFTFELLRFVKSANGYTALTLLPVALGDCDCDVTIHWDMSVLGNASVYARATLPAPQDVQVSQRTLDGLSELHKIPAPSFIKIDVEGAEMKVLQGGRRTIEHHRPFVLFEYNREMATAAGWDLARALSLLSGMADYMFFLADRSGDLLGMSIDAIPSLGPGYWDILAAPLEKRSRLPC
jgi:FkbM family methyltransferase